MKVLGIVGWSGSGKTTLIEQVIPRFVSAGLRVSLIKHAHDRFDVDQPGKDSWRHRQAGAREVMVSSSRRWALVHELRDEAEPPLDALLAQMSQVDFIFVEGFKRDPFPKLEVHRTALGKPLIAPDDPDIVAIAADRPVTARGLPRFDLDDAETIARFIAGFCRPA